MPTGDVRSRGLCERARCVRWRDWRKMHGCLQLSSFAILPTQGKARQGSASEGLCCPGTVRGSLAQPWQPTNIRDVCISYHRTLAGSPESRQWPSARSVTSPSYHVWLTVPRGVAQRHLLLRRARRLAGCAARQGHDVDGCVGRRQDHRAATARLTTACPRYCSMGPTSGGWTRHSYTRRAGAWACWWSRTRWASLAKWRTPWPSWIRVSSSPRGRLESFSPTRG